MMMTMMSSLLAVVSRVILTGYQTILQQYDTSGNLISVCHNVSVVPPKRPVHPGKDPVVRATKTFVILFTLHLV